MKFNRIQVLCPANAITGGPEALHHLVSILTKIGLDAYIVYLPIGIKASTPEQYKNFNVKIMDFDDVAGDLIIFPEIMPMEALCIKNAQAAIWWLSVDNFLLKQSINNFRDWFRYKKSAFKGQRPKKGVIELNNLIHFSQSYYSTEFLSRNGIESIPFYESINSKFLTGNLDPGCLNRIDEILFNPKKGLKLTQKLINKFPQFKFTALAGFNHVQLSNKFSSAKVYIDFAHHPGRDRLPREAAMHGCCIVTSFLGSAANNIDIPIPAGYKIETKSHDFEKRFELLILDIFKQFSLHHEAFKNYRERIQNEPLIFESQVSSYFLNNK
jgi:hypothetical protein